LVCVFGIGLGASVGAGVVGAGVVGTGVRAGAGSESGIKVRAGAGVVGTGIKAGAGVEAGVRAGAGSESGIKVRAGAGVRTGLEAGVRTRVEAGVRTGIKVRDGAGVVGAGVKVEAAFLMKDSTVLPAFSRKDLYFKSGVYFKFCLYCK
jgi:hypothetical protein